MFTKRLVLLLGLYVLVAVPASAQTLWYNGDFDGVNGIGNERNTDIADSCTYDDFIVPVGETWNVTSVFSNNQMDITTDIADYEIRQGVSAGNGGTLLFSGTGVPATQTPTGNTHLGRDEFTIEAAVSLSLGPGTYWLCVRPVGNGTGLEFLSTTSGANAIGAPPGDNDNSFIDSAFFGLNFEPTATIMGAGNEDFSMGVRGVRVLVPEPGSLALLLGVGVTGTLVVLRRKRS